MRHLTPRLCIEQTTMSAEQRDEVGLQLLPAIKDYWLTGSGLGSFESVYPRYRHADIQYFWRHAHNDYLEFSLETGVIGIAMLASFMLINIGKGLRRCWRMRDPVRWGVAMGAMMSTTALLVHSFADFNLQIPANAMLFMITQALFWYEPPSAPAPRTITVL